MGIMTGGGDYWDGYSYSKRAADAGFVGIRGALGTPIDRTAWESVTKDKTVTPATSTLSTYIDPETGTTYMRRDAGQGYMRQIATPEYELEGRASVTPYAREAEESGYSDRVGSKIKQLGRSTNSTIKDLNATKQDHVTLVDTLNYYIGRPTPGDYLGWSSNSVNQAIAYANEKAFDGALSAQKHADNAIAAANSVQAAATSQGAALQARFDEAGGQVEDAISMRATIDKIMSREATDATPTTQQTPSVFDETKVFQSISDWLK